MSEDKFIQKANALLDMHSNLTLEIEKFRRAMGELEQIERPPLGGKMTIASEILGMNHHFILNGLNNQFYALREGITRAMNAHNAERVKA